MTRSTGHALLLAALADPSCSGNWSLTQWSDGIAAARACNLLGALAERLADAGLEAPPPADRHLLGTRRLSARQRLSVRWEAHCLQQALGRLGVPVVLLKGAAYVVGDLPAARGRLFGDIDILVPRGALGDVEAALMLSGYAGFKTDPYDQRYYRDWMHELPPMTQVHRGTVVDVHHTILPLTARNMPDPAQIVARSRPVPGLPALRVPAVEDLLTHSLTHLVHEGEVDQVLRDLHDVDVMLRHAGTAPGFWSRLTQVAAGNDLAAPVGLGLRLARRYFGSPVPDPVIAELAPAGRRLAMGRWLERVYDRALQASPSGEGGASASAKLWLYLRAHGLRMPPRLLLPHLARKSWRSAVRRWSEAAKAERVLPRFNVDGLP